MAKRNSFLERQQNEKNFYFDVGVQYGRQQIIDAMSLALHDPDVMQKDTFGKTRLLKLVNAIGDYIDRFQPAWEKRDDTDYYRAKLDAALSDAYGVELHDSFERRYEYSPEYNYTKGKWK